MKSNHYLGLKYTQLGNLLLPSILDSFRTEVITVCIKLGIPGIKEEG